MKIILVTLALLSTNLMADNCSDAIAKADKYESEIDRIRNIQTNYENLQIVMLKRQNAMENYVKASKAIISDCKDGKGGYTHPKASEHIYYAAGIQTILIEMMADGIYMR